MAAYYSAIIILSCLSNLSNCSLKNVFKPKLAITKCIHGYCLLCRSTMIFQSLLWLKAVSKVVPEVPHPDELSTMSELAHATKLQSSCQGSGDGSQHTPHDALVPPR